MDDWDWDDDEPERDRNRSVLLKNRNWTSIDIEFEARRGRITLTWEEWKKLQGWLSRYDTAENFMIRYKDYKDLPPNVIEVIRDWILHRRRIVNKRPKCELE